MGILLIDPIMTLYGFIRFGVFVAYFDPAFVGVGTVLYAMTIIITKPNVIAPLMERDRLLGRNIRALKKKTEGTKASSAMQVASAYTKAWHDKLCPKLDLLD